MFAAIWLPGAVVWSVALYLEGLVGPATVVGMPGLHAAMVGGAQAVCRRDPEARRVVPVVVATCALLALSTLALFAVAAASGGFAMFLMLFLFLLASLLFAWGWRVQLALIGVTVPSWLLIAPRLSFYAPTVELGAAIVAGSLICFTVAEGAARAFASAWHHRAAEAESRRQLEASRDAFRALAEKAEQARRQAEAAARARDHFLAILSHELGSPLQVLLTWTSMLRSGRVADERVPQALGTIEDCGKALTRLVSDMLDLSRIDAGKLSLHRTDVDVCPLLAARVEAARDAAAEKGLTIEAHLEPGGAVVHGDATRLGQVFSNLLANAVKFTPAGGRITVACWHETDQAIVTVSDTGIGIPADVLPSVFDEFRQAEPAITDRYGGLGLGLAIARKLVERHGGRITAESAGPGQGTTFRVSLPLAGAHAVLARLRVLVVDDGDDTRGALEALLADAGAEVRTAATVGEALERAAATPPDVVVTDLALAHDATVLVHRLRETGRDVPAIAIVLPEDRRADEAARAEGFTEQVTKPVLPETLIEVVARSAAARQGRRT